MPSPPTRRSQFEIKSGGKARARVASCRRARTRLTARARPSHSSIATTRVATFAGSSRVELRSGRQRGDARKRARLRPHALRHCANAARAELWRRLALDDRSPAPRRYASDSARTHVSECRGERGGGAPPKTRSPHEDERAAGVLCVPSHVEFTSGARATSDESADSS